MVTMTTMTIGKERTRRVMERGKLVRFLSTSKEILSTLSVKELRKIITDNGLHDKGCIDKDSLVERAAEALMIKQKEDNLKSTRPTMDMDNSHTTAKKEGDSVTSSPQFSSSSVSQTQEQKDQEMKRKIIQMIISDKDFSSLRMESLNTMMKSPSLEALKASFDGNPELNRLVAKLLVITGDMSTLIRISQQIMQNPFK